MGDKGWVDKHSLNKEDLTVRIFETDTALPVDNISDPDHPAYGVSRATGNYASATTNKNHLEAETRIKNKLRIKVNRARTRAANEAASKASMDFSGFETSLGT